MTLAERHEALLRELAQAQQEAAAWAAKVEQLKGAVWLCRELVQEANHAQHDGEAG